MASLPITIETSDPEDPSAILLLDALSDTLQAITGSSGRASFDPADMRGAGALFVLARDERGVAVGCGGYRPLIPGVAEVKRMYARPGTRGVGAVLLDHLEQRAADDGYAELQLETRLVNARAVQFYERSGYRRIPNFGCYVGRPEAGCFAKQL